MIQTDDASADVTAARIIVSRNQRTDSGVSPQDTCLRQARSQLGTLGQKQIHLVWSHLQMIAFLVRNPCGSRTDNADRVSRHKDVSVGRLAATVDNHAVDPVRENQQCPLCREHTYVSPGHLSDVMPPDAAGVDRHWRVVVCHDPCVMVKHLHALDRVLLLDELYDF